MKDKNIDAIKSIYVLLLTCSCEVVECTREDNFVTIEIALFYNPKKTSLYEHNYHHFKFQLSPEDNGLICDYPVEQEQWSHP
ncbi:hypothetical protein LCGC14_1869670 [marine sediment metagenome]|uniref:Uncharacterized protein n=1 Tax=marine sediment metagenome TaxID=412755 RepID=A0A0F9IJC7_9ZZZZ